MKEGLWAVAWLAGCLLTGCSKQEGRGPAELAASKGANLPVAQVTVIEARVRAQARPVEVMGTVRPQLRAIIEAKASGRIEKMAVGLGQRVKAGELLLEIEARDREARAEQAAATRRQADTDLKRMTALLKQEALTQAEFDGAEARFRVADAALREAETMLGYATVAAPFDGMVARKLADVGDLAAPGKPLLELEDSEGMRFVAEVPESLIARIAVGKEMEVRFEGDLAAKATVAEVAPMGDPVTRTARVELKLEGRGLRSGTFGRLLVPAGEETMLLVPASAIQKRGQMELMFVARDGHAELRLVKTGREFGAEVEVLSGIAAGEKIIGANGAGLRDGQPISIP